MHIEKRGIVISDWYFGEGMATNGAGKKVKKERNDEIYSFNFHSYLDALFLFFQKFIYSC